MLSETGAQIGADPITLIIDGSGFGVNALILFLIFTAVMLAHDRQDTRRRSGK